VRPGGHSETQGIGAAVVVVVGPAVVVVPGAAVVVVVVVVPGTPVVVVPGATVVVVVEVPVVVVPGAPVVVVGAPVVVVGAAVVVVVTHPAPVQISSGSQASAQAVQFCSVPSGTQAPLQQVVPGELAQAAVRPQVLVAVLQTPAWQVSGLSAQSSSSQH